MHVVNIDDNYPQFTSASYIGEYPESTPVGTTLLKVEAWDADQDTLLYTLLSCCNARSSLDLFRIDPESGKFITEKIILPPPPPRTHTHLMLTHNAVLRLKGEQDDLVYECGIPS